ncbi:MAG: hypothetical protein F6K58_09080 [Symploca sp. SIO2E9]|nr:hypothetical protein [Symploca sp. SIO2E9]
MLKGEGERGDGETLQTRRWGEGGMGRRSRRGDGERGRGGDGETLQTRRWGEGERGRGGDGSGRHYSSGLTFI